MSNNDNNRLDRIESLLESIAVRVESIAAQQEKFSQNLEKSNKKIDSNARAIEALTEERRANEQASNRDRSRLYQAMAELSTAQANFYGRLEEVDQRQDQLSRRQGEIVQILKLLTQPKNSDSN